MVDCHLILRERSCLIRTNHVGAPERFNGGQFLHKRVLFGHFLYSYSQRKRYRRQQPFRDKGDNHSQGKQKRFHPWIFHQEYGDQEEYKANAKRDCRDLLGQYIQFLLQWGKALFRILGQICDFAKLTVCPR